ncbi:unnamed protein product [Rotaria sordida]|uniref:B30.2/SPRY domain-containing protein n=1 Tax=Rotaria sordida TaxID=392033 RepID=A0A819BCV3_9BILA|nr:unnamed protein product [Rotaria sordida]
MVLPRKTKSTGIRHELNNSTKKSKTIATNSKQKTLHTKRKKLTKRVDLNDPSINTITLRRSRRLTNKKKQLSNLSCDSTSNLILPSSSSNSVPTNSTSITKSYPLRSRLRRASLTGNNQITTISNRRSRISKQQDLLSTSLSSMGLRNGKIVNLRSIISGTTSQTNEELTTSNLPLLSFNPLPRQHHQINNSTSSTSYSPTNSYSNNNNNNNDLNVPICQYHYSNITNHPSLDPSKYFPVRLDILLDRPPVSREKQIEYGWNHDDRSMNIFVKHNDPCTFHRHPVAQSTDAVRCKKGFTSGIHVWEIEWNTRQRGTHAVVGVGTIKAPLHCPGYQALVGMNQESWGWDLGRNKLYHKGVNSVYASTQYPSSTVTSSNSLLSPTTTTSTLTDPADAINNNGISYPSKSDECFVVPDKFLVVLDLEEGTLAYIVDGQYLGVAFNDLKDKDALYPMVSSVWGHCEITMRYINGLEPEPLQLMDSCRRVIRKRLGRTNLNLINHLTLPTSLHNCSIICFFLFNRRRLPLANIDDSMTRKRPNHNRLSLIKMAQATRTFWTQAEALEFINERQKNEKKFYTGEILYLFSFESQPDGRRRYQVADIDVFIHEYYQLPANQRHTYEIIIDKKPSKLYFDLEYDIAANPNIDGPKLTNNFIQFVLNFMRKGSDDLNYSMKDVLILDSTSSTKFSRHLIFQTKDPFLDNLAVGKFVNLILEDIHGCLINHQCSAVHNISSCQNQQTQSYSDSSVYAKNLLVTIESCLFRYEQCKCIDDYSQLRFKDIIEFIVKKNDDSGLTWFCDMSVYTKNRAFRLLRSSKFDKQECFMVAPENEWRPTLRRSHTHLSSQPSEAECQTFMASLVYFNGPIRRFIHVDDANTTSTKSVISRSHQSTYITDDLQKVSLDYPELVNFMMNIARDKKHDVNGIRISRLYKAKEIQNDFRWEIGFMYVGDYKYCERIQRHHKNNNIYFVVDMRKGTYRQKCHDPDCKAFQGIEQTLPINATPWLTVVNQEWDNQSPKSMKETL